MYCLTRATPYIERTASRRSAPQLFHLRTMVRQALPATALLHVCHTANNGSSAVLTLDHGIVALLETCQSDVSHDFGPRIANIALRELIVCRIARLFN